MILVKYHHFLPFIFIYIYLSTNHTIMTNYLERLDEIRMHYYIHHQDIVSSYPKSACYGFPIRTIKDVTPIEFNVLGTIKECNLPLLPQYPVLNYFVDFGDPIKKIAIEVDGVRYHTDKVKDNKRQSEIEALGWTFYRITGTKTYEIMEDFYQRITGCIYGETAYAELIEFYERYKYQNSDCLIHYIDYKHYTKVALEQNYSDSETEDCCADYEPVSMSDLVKDHNKRLDIRRERYQEWLQNKDKLRKNFIP